MPIMERTPQPPSLRVAASAPLELMWVVHNIQSKHLLQGSYGSIEPVRERFGSVLKTFWDDGARGFTEAMVLAHWGGTQLDLDLDRFFETLDAVAARGGDSATLLSESPAERRAFGARLERLRSDPDLRSRYRQLLLDVWTPLAEEWRDRGCPAVVAEAEAWSKRLAAGEDFRGLLDRQRIWPGRPEMDDLANAAYAEGRMVLSPGWFFGEIHVVEIDGAFYLGRGVRAEDYEALLRATSTRIAGNLKALADPTRLKILLELAHNPSSVTAVARCFELSQPTVSAHVQVLREAGLIEEKPNGRSSTLTVRASSLKKLFEDSEQSLLHLFPRGGG